MTKQKTTADEPKLVLEAPHTCRRDETRLTPTSKKTTTTKNVQFRRDGWCAAGIRTIWKLFYIINLCVHIDIENHEKK